MMKPTSSSSEAQSTEEDACTYARGSKREVQSRCAFYLTSVWSRVLNKHHNAFYSRIKIIPLYIGIQDTGNLITCH